MEENSTKKSSVEKSNSSDNSYYAQRQVSKKQRILTTVEESEIELTPVQIARKTEIKPSTTRMYLRRLLQESRVVQPYPGAYCSKITHGMIFAPLRVHNVLLGFEASWLDFSDEVVELVGDVKIRVQFGLQRHKVTGQISCDSGMDRHTIRFALDRFYEIVEKRMGGLPDEVVVKTFEVNRDMHGVRLDGCKCYTREGLFGMIDRVYQKEEDVVRAESKVVEPMGVDQFLALIQGGVTGYNYLQGLFMAVQQIGKLTDAVKFLNDQNEPFRRFSQAVWERMQKGEEFSGFEPVKGKGRPSYVV